MRAGLAAHQLLLLTLSVHITNLASFLFRSGGSRHANEAQLDQCPG